MGIKDLLNSVRSNKGSNYGNDGHDRDNKPAVSVGKKLAIGASALVAAIFAVDGWTIIDQKERGLDYRMGKLTTQETKDIRQPGINFKLPIFQSIRKHTVTLQEITLPDESIYTKDSQEIKGTVSVQFTVPEEKLIHIAKTNPDYKAIMITNVKQALKDAFGKTEATNIASNRDEVMLRASENVKESVNESLGLQVARVQLPNFEFEDTFKKSIASAMGMKAEAEKAKLAVAKAESEANSAIQNARGIAESTKLQAEADFFKAQKTADGELYKLQKASEGQTRLSSAIGKENLASYWFNQTWNGELPKVSGGSSVTMMDAQSLIGAAAAKKMAEPAPAAK